MSRPEIERLVQRLSETEEQLQELLAGEVDAVVAPSTAVPILLSKAQKALATSEARYRELIARCPALVCEIEPGGQVRFANDAVRSLLGYDFKRLGDAYWWETVVPREYLASARRFAAAIQRGNVANYELPLRTAAGEVAWILWTTANRYDARGVLERVLAFGIDITSRKRAEDASRCLDDAELARIQAESANKAKSEFLAIMSHELRTPLNAIGGYAELMELGVHGPVTAEQCIALGRIQSSQRHLLGLINDLMNFAKLETGRVSFNPEFIAANEVLAVVEALTAPQAAAKGLEYRVGRCDPGLTLYADRERTQQILINLVSNAVKFTPSAGRIEIECEEGAREVRVHVTDTGVGIPADKLDAIFDPFVQVQSGFTRSHEGVGLGLAISRDLAHMMHGTLHVSSAIGCGSRFTLTLPRQP